MVCHSCHSAYKELIDPVHIANSFGILKASLEVYNIAATNAFGILQASLEVYDTAAANTFGVLKASCEVYDIAATIAFGVLKTSLELYDITEAFCTLNAFHEVLGMMLEKHNVANALGILLHVYWLPLKPSDAIYLTSYCIACIITNASFECTWNWPIRVFEIYIDPLLAMAINNIVLKCDVSLKNIGCEGATVKVAFVSSCFHSMSLTQVTIKHRVKCELD